MYDAHTNKKFQAKGISTDAKEKSVSFANNTYTVQASHMHLNFTRFYPTILYCSFSQQRSITQQQSSSTYHNNIIEGQYLLRGG